MTARFSARKRVWFFDFFIPITVTLRIFWQVNVFFFGTSRYSVNKSRVRLYATIRYRWPLKPQLDFWPVWSVIYSVHRRGANRGAAASPWSRWSKKKQSTVATREQSRYKLGSGKRSLVFTLLAFVRRNAEEQKNRIGEGSLCLWRGRRGSDIPPRCG